MKTHTAPLTLLTIAGITLITLSGAYSQAVAPAQSPADQAQSTANPPAGHHLKAPKAGQAHKKHEAVLQNLTDAEKAQLKAAKRKIHNNPQLGAANQAVKDAQTKEAREAAKKAKKQLKHDLLLKADPSLQPILDKITPGKPSA